MPYIRQIERNFWDATVLHEFMNALDAPGDLSPGELNYVLSKMIWAIFDTCPSYTMANELVGVLECVKQEFIRRKLNPYEDKKIESNGDLEPYEDCTEEQFSPCSCIACKEDTDEE
jgi:hypothetical protein